MEPRAVQVKRKKIMKKIELKTEKAVANNCGAMEADTISKHGRKSKSLMSRFNFKILALVILVAGVFIFVMCKKDDDLSVPKNVVKLINEPEPYPEAEEWGEKTDTIPGSSRSWTEESNDPPEDWEGTRSSRLDDCFTYNTDWKCDTIRYSASKNPNDFVMYNPTASVLWPGNLVQGNSLSSGIPTSIPVTKRQSGNISLAVVTSGSAGAAMYRTVDKMQFSYVNQAMNDILSGFTGQGYAQYIFDMDIVKSSEHLEFLLNASFAGWGASVRAGLSIGSSDDMTRIIVKLHQSYFTMVYDDPAGLDGVFTPDITENDLRNYTGNGNPICYISSVTYGRMYYLLFESSASEDALTAALNASYKGFGTSMSAETEIKTRETLEKTTARVFQMGGGGEGGISAGMAVDLEAIRSFMEKGINFNAQNTGAPISYTVKYLKNAKIVRMNNLMEYNVEQCESKTTVKECPEPPQLTTNPVEKATVGSNSAIVSGNITFEGIPPYFERGFIYATNPNPTIEDGIIKIPGSGTGNFNGTINGLTPNTSYYVQAFATNEGGTAWSKNVESFMTTKSLPIVVTNEASNITATSATLGGTITNVGSPPYLIRGVVYSITPNPSHDNFIGKKEETGSGGGIFSFPVTDLTPNTIYYVCAFATNNDGTSYGEQVSFKTLDGKPQVRTNAITTFTASTATMGGNIINAGTPPYTVRGIVYSSTTQNPEIDGDNVKNEVVAGQGITGVFSTPITGLTPNTTYYVKAYAINTGSTVYGDVETFKTYDGFPVVKTSAASNITASTATLNGNVVDAGTPQYTKRGMVYSTIVDPMIGGDNVVNVEISGTGTGPFSTNVSELADEKKYYVKAYVIRETKQVPFYGEQVEFTTGIKLSLTTNEPSNFTATTATLGGYITNEGTPAYTEKGVVYSTSPNPTTTSPGKLIVPGSGPGNFDAFATGLTPNTPYYVRAYAINDTEGTKYGNEVSFTTLSGIPTLTTNPATNVLANSVTLGGNITYVGSPAYFVRGVVWATTHNPTIYNHSQAVPGTGEGPFSVDVTTNINPSTLYYARAYATNAEGTEYGNEVSFTTVSLTQIYIDSDGTLKAAPVIPTPYTNQTSLGTTGGTTWISVSDDKTAPSRITIQGDVRIILMDGCNLNVSTNNDRGINVTGSSSLTIYGQQLGTGILSATASSGNAGIGGNAGESGGIITINGGIIIAKGGDGTGGGNGYNGTGGTGGGAGIGGGGGFGGGNGNNPGSNGFSGGNITINGGNIEAIGGARSFNGTGHGAGGGGGRGAGIGGGGGGGGAGRTGCSISFDGNTGYPGGNNSDSIGNGANGGNGGKACSADGAVGGAGGQKGTVLPNNINTWITNQGDGYVKIVKP